MFPKIVVVLGAGASWGIAPSTPELTGILRRMWIPVTDNYRSCRYNDSARRVFDELDPDGKKQFEELLAMALTMAESPSPTYDESWTTAFGQGSQRIALEIVNKMKNYQVTGVKASSVKLLNVLADHPMTIASLNWDDLPLGSNGSWYDGYNHDVDQSVFDPEFLWEFPDHHHRLLWLHGSIHFNRPSVKDLMDNPVDFAFRWFKNPDEAVYGWVQGLERDPMGNLVPQLPVVLGSHKPAQMFMRPFFDYWGALYQDVLKTEILVIAGYSGNDLHLNTLLAEALRYNPKLRDIIWINKFNGSLDVADRFLGQTLPVIFRDVDYLFMSLNPLDSIDGFQVVQEARGRKTWVALQGIDTVVTNWLDQLRWIVNG